MKTFLLAVTLLVLAVPARSQDAYLGAGFYFGPTCVPGIVNCSPNPTIQSPALYVSFPSGAGTATIAAGWAESGDLDGYQASCNNPSQWTAHGFGSVSYNDGTISYSGPIAYDVTYADTAAVALPSGDICCWQNVGGQWQPKKYFVYKVKLRSCTSGHVLTNRFIAVGCDGYTYGSIISDPGCPFVNMNYIPLTVSGF